MAKAVRMADIAQRLGISTVSVSKGLAGKEGVSAEMRAKILATAEEMGYQPPARTNAHPGGESIGILVADRFFNENAFYSNLYRAVLKAATEQDISVLMEIVLPQAEKSCNMPTFLVNRKVDGLIFMGGISRRYLATAVQTGVPFMLLDFYDDAIAADCVLSDNTSGSYTMTEHLISTGRRNIGFVGSVLSTSSIMDRYLGYVKAMLRAGLPIRDDWRLEDRDDQGKFVPFSLPHEMPDAFVCNCDAVAYNLVEILKRNGYRVPQDVAVTGYDDYRYSTICSPQLTSYRVDLDGMAKTVVAQLRRKMAHKPAIAPTVIVPGGFGDRGIEGMIQAAQYARENRVPCFGICLGMQIAAIAFARGVLGYEDANSTEFAPDSKHPVIGRLEEQLDLADMGGTMRLGAYPCRISPDTLMMKAYGKGLIEERHRHRYEFNNKFREVYMEHGAIFSGQSPDGTLVEAMEIPGHPFYLGVQYHPEFKSRPNRAHPIFREFVKAALEVKEKNS